MKILNIYKGKKRGITDMKNLSQKLSALAIATLFASMQFANADGLSNATINSTQGGFVNMQNGTNSATLNFNGNAHVDWKTLNVNSNETLNFNAIKGASGLTVLNTVSGGQMSQIYGSVNANSGIKNLIISNPSGMMFDGAHFSTAGDLMLTTQKLNATGFPDEMRRIDNDFSIARDDGSARVYKMKITADKNAVATGSINIKDSVFKTGGQMEIVAPNMDLIHSAIKADKGVKLVTRDGVDYLVSANNGTVNKGVRLESVSIDGDVYIVSGKDYTKVVNGGTVSGNMKIDSNGIVALNYVNNGEKLTVKGDLIVDSDGALNPGRTAIFSGHGNMMYLRNADVDGNLHMANSGGFLEVKDINVAKNADLTTTTGPNSHVKHFVHVIGDSKVGGNFDINSAHNIHIGNYDIKEETLLPGNLSVGGTLNAHANDGHVMVTIDTQADKIALKSDTLNVLSDDKAVLKANEYKFEANGYIGGIGTYVNDKGEVVDGTRRIISLMENYTHIPVDIKAHKYMNIAGGDVTKINAPGGAVYLKSTGDMTVDNTNAGQLNLTAVSKMDPLGGNIELKDNVKAGTVVIGGETKLLTLPLESRQYKLKYTRINGTKETVIDGDTEITYDMLEGEPDGYNNGKQTSKNTKIKAPAAPLPPEPPVDDDTDTDTDIDIDTDTDTDIDTDTDTDVDTDTDTDDDITPPDHDNIKFLNNLTRDQIASAIDAGQVYTPIAFAADLDDEVDTGVRKNVDGSVTVVKPYTPSNK